MSGLFNLRVNGTAAEDIFCNGQAVEEVWVDGVQVFDAYDPQAVPNGTLSFSGFSGGLPSNYADAQNGANHLRTSTGQAGATGYIQLSAGDTSLNFSLEEGDTSCPWHSSMLSSDQDHYCNSNGTPISHNDSTSSYIGLYYADGSPLFTINSRSYHKSSGISDELFGYAAGDFRIYFGSVYHGSKSAKIEWNFKTKKVTISGSNGFTTVTRDLSSKWREGMYVQASYGGGYGAYGDYIYLYDQVNRVYCHYVKSSMSVSAGN